MLNVHELTLNQFWNGALIPGNRAGRGKKEGDKERIHTARHHAAVLTGRTGKKGKIRFSTLPERKIPGKLYLPGDERTVKESPILRDRLFYRLEGPSMIALWLMFQPPPSAVYRDTSVLAC